MKIIAIEGLDKSGKATQTEMLVERLQAEGLRVIHSEFHRYDTPTGDLIAKWLGRKWDVDQKTIELIMAADKQAQQGWFEKLEADGVDALVLDRYTGSQYAYSAAAGMSTTWVHHLLENIRHPDFQVFIDIDPVTSMTRKGKHNNGENDRYESDLELLTRVRGLFKKLYPNKDHPGKKSFDYAVVNGEQPIEQIHQEIYEAVRGAFAPGNEGGKDLAQSI